MNPAEDPERGWVDLIEADAVPRGDNVYLEVEGLRLLVHRIAQDHERAHDRFYVTSSQCPHEDFTMDRCPLHGTRLICTEHGWEMDVRTGRVVAVGDEDARLPVFPARLVAGRVWAKLF